VKTARLFNAIYARTTGSVPTTDLQSWDGFFFPLDRILQWNRIYGRRGFVQFQCVLPENMSKSGVSALITESSRAKLGSFLSVLKKMGADHSSSLAFPMQGYTLAMDFPFQERSLDLIRRLERIVIDHGGRHYLAKDAVMSPEMLRKTDPRWGVFQKWRNARGLDEFFASKQSERLEI